jgi:hypothetical protein
MAVYSRQIASAKKLILKYGQNVTWRKLVNGSPVDINQPWKPTSGTVTDYTVSIAFFTTSKMNNETQTYVKGTDIQKGSIIGYMAAVEFAPNPNDVVIRDGEQLVVEAFDVLNVNGEIIIYELKFKR